MEHPQGISKLFDFVFRSGFFTIDLLEGLKDFVDVIEGLFQFIADVQHLIDGLMDAGGGPVVGAGFRRLGRTAAGTGTASSTGATTTPPEGRATRALAGAVLRGS